MSTLGDVVLTGLEADKPSPSIPGRIYFASDSFIAYRDTGTAWVQVTLKVDGTSITVDGSGIISFSGGGGGGGGLGFFGVKGFTDPTTNTFTQLNGSTTPTVTQTTGAINLYVPTSGSSGSFNATLMVVAAPATPYSLIACLLPGLMAVNYHSTGILVRNSSSGKVVYFGPHFENNVAFDHGQIDSTTSFDAHYNGYPTNCPLWLGNAVWLKLSDDGTNRKWYWSPDGMNWTLLAQEATGDFTGTVDQIGWMVDGQSNVFDAQATLISWETTSP